MNRFCLSARFSSCLLISIFFVIHQNDSAGDSVASDRSEPSEEVGPAERGLVLHYTFDRPRMDEVEPDKSGRGNHAKIHGTTWNNDGHVNGAIELNGTSDFLDCGTDKSLNFGTSDFTVALWFNASLKEDLPRSYGSILNKGAAGSMSPVRPGYGLYQTIEHDKSILRWDFGQRSHAARARVISDQWKAKCWNHMVLVRRGEEIEAYLNGEHVAKEIQKPTSDASVSGPEHLYLGLIVDNRKGKHFFKGLLDDVRIYERALPAEVIRSLAKMGTSNVVDGVKLEVEIEKGDKLSRVKVFVCNGTDEEFRFETGSRGGGGSLDDRFRISPDKTDRDPSDRAIQVIGTRPTVIPTVYMQHDDSSLNTIALRPPSFGGPTRRSMRPEFVVVPVGGRVLYASFASPNRHVTGRLSHVTMKLLDDQLLLGKSSK